MSNASNHRPTVPLSFHVMAKPIGPLCNLDCTYCFYLEKEKLFPQEKNYRMSDAVLEAYIRKYIQSQQAPEIQFGWQGGEPSLMGVDFFRKVVAFQRRYAGGRTVHNAFQTNGTNLDDEWCEFFAREKFLVGISLDGPEHIHNRYRLDKGGAGSFEHVMNGLALLKKWRVEFNILTCVTRQSPAEAVEIYAFLKQQNVKFMQFIPIVERVSDRASPECDFDLAEPPDLHSCDNSAAMMPWSVDAVGFGEFLVAIFDEWLKADVGTVFVNLFDMALGAWCGAEPNLCTYAQHCGRAMALEHDGNVYTCDHYVYPAYLLGNVLDKSFEEMLFSPAQVQFGRDKTDALPTECRECEFLFTCNGDCPKHRFITAANGEPGLSYLCAGYKKFFKHIDPAMREMAALVNDGRPAMDIMQKKVGRSDQMGRNDRCACGSGKKFKKCCEKER